MLDLNQQQLGAIRGSTVPPVVVPTGTNGTQPNGNFSCTPTDIGCIPTPNQQSSNPMTSMIRPQNMPITPQQGVQPIPQAGTQKVFL